jgi:hypothetical protein
LITDQNKKYDLEERTALFGGRVRNFCLKLSKNIANAEQEALQALTKLKQMRVLEIKILK